MRCRAGRSPPWRPSSARCCRRRVARLQPDSQREWSMHVYETGDLAPVPTRAGIAARSLAGPKHGITAFFVQENQLDDGATIPMHHHPIDEVVIVTSGELTVE